MKRPFLLIFTLTALSVYGQSNSSEKNYDTKYYSSGMGTANNLGENINLYYGLNDIIFEIVVPKLILPTIYFDINFNGQFDKNIDLVYTLVNLDRAINLNRIDLVSLRANGYSNSAIPFLTKATISSTSLGKYTIKIPKIEILRNNPKFSFIIELRTLSNDIYSASTYKYLPKGNSDGEFSNTKTFIGDVETMNICNNCSLSTIVRKNTSYVNHSNMNENDIAFTKGSSQKYYINHSNEIVDKIENSTHLRYIELLADKQTYIVKDFITATNQKSSEAKCTSGNIRSGSYRDYCKDGIISFFSENGINVYEMKDGTPTQISTTNKSSLFENFLTYMNNHRPTINDNVSSSSSNSSSSEKCTVFMETKREESASYKNWRELKLDVNNENGKLDYITFYYDPTSVKYKTSVTITNTSFDSLNDIMKYLMKLHHGCSTFKKDYNKKSN